MPSSGSVERPAEPPAVPRDAERVNVSRLEEVEHALQQSEAFYRSLVETLPGHILRKDAEGRFTFANSRFLKTLGITLDQLIGKTDFDFYPSELAAKYQADDRDVMQSGRTSELTEAHQSASGKIYVHVVKTPVLDDGGKAIGIQCIFWDVTDQKRLEEQVQYERDLLTSLLDASPDAIYFKDRESRFLRASRSCALKVGYADAAAIIGQI